MMVGGLKMAKRKIILIDEEKCTGCGVCIPGCPEGALEIVDGKAKLVSDEYCDGLGACLKDCPEDAITIIEREADDFDEKAAVERLQRLRREKAKEAVEQDARKPFFCPSEKVMQFNRETSETTKAEATETSVAKGSGKSQLNHWPIQIKLVPASAPYLKDANLLIAADCVPFAYAGFHQEMLKGKVLLVGCPKLDDPNFYIEKLGQIFKENDIKQITTAYMEVPCCFGLNHLITKALEAAGKDIPVDEVTITIEGDMKEGQ